MKKKIAEKKYILFLILFLFASVNAEIMIIFDLESCTINKTDEIYLNSFYDEPEGRYLITINAENELYKFNRYSLKNAIFIPLKKEITVEIIDQEENKIVCNKTFQLNYEEESNKYEKITNEYSDLEKSIKKENNINDFKNSYPIILIILIVLVIILIFNKAKKFKKK